VARALEAARRQIFIADWRLNPDVLLTRWPDPPLVLKDLLLQKANEGVDVFVLVYKEVVCCCDTRGGGGGGGKIDTP
jgi:phospholipase D1/2